MLTNLGRNALTTSTKSKIWTKYSLRDGQNGNANHFQKAGNTVNFYCQIFYGVLDVFQCINTKKGTAGRHIFGSHNKSVSQLTEYKNAKETCNILCTICLVFSTAYQTCKTHFSIKEKMQTINKTVTKKQIIQCHYSCCRKTKIQAFSRRGYDCFIKRKSLYFLQNQFDISTFYTYIVNHGEEKDYDQKGFDLSNEIELYYVPTPMFNQCMAIKRAQI